MNKLTKEKVSILIKCYRVYRFFWVNHMEFISNVIYKMVYLIFGCTIPPTSKLGKGVNVAHPIGIVVHQNAVIGDNTIIYQNVTIGRRNGNLEESPVIGNNCILGVGCCILGDIKVGDNVKIGANAVVVKDVPSNVTVVGVPAKIIKESKKV